MGPFDTECERCKRGYQQPLPPIASPEPGEPLQQAVDVETEPPKEELITTQARAIRTGQHRYVLIALMLLIIGVGIGFAVTRYTAGAAEHKALRAILDLDDAVNVGVSYLTYADYVIKARQAVQQAKREAPAFTQSSKFWTEIAAALDDYEFAQRIWDYEFDESDLDNHISDEVSCAVIRQRYPDIHYTYAAGDTFDGTAESVGCGIDLDEALRTAWAAADTHTQHAQGRVNPWPRTQ